MWDSIRFSVDHGDGEASIKTLFDENPGESLVSVNELDTFGLMFETMCIRDLRIYADALGGSFTITEIKTALNVTRTYI